MLESIYQPKKIEEEVRNEWRKIHVQSLIRKTLSDRKPVGYVEGPPTLNGEPHIGHVRGRILKDLWYRFSTLQGLNVVFRAGWDTQGLPVELQAERELGLAGSKAENLKTIGEEALVEACKRLIMKYYEKWREADLLLGMSFDYEKAYWTFHNDYIEREWKYLEQAWKNGLLAEGYRVVAYCPSCQTSLSHAEVSQGYEVVEDPSLFFKMKMCDQDSFLILWTTMPFTIVTDEMVGVKPDAQYTYVRVSGETWIVGSERLDALMNELGVEKYDFIKTVLGSDLEGRKYEHPLVQYIPGQEDLQKSPSAHMIVAEDFVDTSSGSGLVHLSPANGEEDFQVAKRRGVQVFNPIDDQVRFTKEAGVFAGLFVRDADAKVAELLTQEGRLLMIGKIRHEYPTCWRSHHKLIWLARREYFYWVDRLGDLAVQAAEKAEYFYEPPRNRFIEIVKEKVPWCISRERVWGTPLPIWVCSSCGCRIGAFSRREIVDKAVKLPDGTDFELHRPWIDRILLRCPDCKSRCIREPYVLDTWHNSGASTYASFDEQEYLNLAPAEFLTEGIDQTRGWAYTLLIENVILTGRAEAPFKAFLFQGHVLDSDGNKMSKSLGNIIEGVEALSNHSVDILRYYIIWKGSPIDSINFSFQEMRGRPFQILNTLYHMHLYFLQNSMYDQFDEAKHSLDWADMMGVLRPQERWLLSKLQSLKIQVDEGFRRCRYHEAARALEFFIIEDLSQTYVPMTRSEIWDDRPETIMRRHAIYSTLQHTLKSLDILLHPISPFATEYLFKACSKSAATSILLEEWPSVDKRYLDSSIVEEFQILSKLTSLSNAARMKAKIKRRWPLPKATILLTNEDMIKVSKHRALLSELMNVKEVLFTSNIADSPIIIKISPKFDLLGPEIRSKISKLSKSLNSMSTTKAFDELRQEGSLTVNIDGRSLKIKEQELNIEYVSDEGYAVAEREGIVVALSVERDKDLVIEGMTRDLARRLQALRKERGYNPTDILEAAYIANPDQQWKDAIESRCGDLSFLVRVKRVNVMQQPVDGIKWSACRIDGAQLQISVE